MDHSHEPESAAHRGREGVDLTRRHISGLAAWALLGGATVTLGCSSGGGSSPSAPSAGVPPAPAPVPGCPSDATCGLVSVDPDHRAVITAAQLADGGALMLDIQGLAGHNHTVALSAEDVAAIRARTRMEKLSSITLGHQHTVIFNA